jgi:hypothetical protein
MKNRIRPLLAAMTFIISLLSGCAAVAVLPFLPAVGTAYTGYVFWKRGEATKYYPFDIDTTYRAAISASEYLKPEATVIKSVPEEGYSLEIQGKVPMHVDILPLEKNITKVVINISTFGDKQYVELFYRLIEDDLPRKTAVGKDEQKTQ